MRITWMKAAVAALTVLLVLAGGRILSPLVRLPGSIRSMLSVTHEILTQTQEMQTEVERVRVGLERVQQQEALLEQQVGLMAGVMGQLTAQEQVAGKSRELLSAILQSERTTVELTAEADKRGAATRELLAANAVRLDRVSGDAVSMAETSGRVNGQMDSIVGHMEQIRDDMAPVGRLKRATSDVLDRASNWLESLVTFFHG